MLNINQIKEWGEFQKSIPYRGKYFLVEEKNNKGEVLISCLLVKYTLMRKFNYLCAVGGPVFNEELLLQEKELEYKESLHKIYAAFFQKVNKIAKSEKSVFVRLNPLIEERDKVKKMTGNDLNTVWRDIVHRFGLINSFKHFYPKYTLVLDLNLSEENLLKQMKQKGRYNIKLARKKSVEVKCVDLSKNPLIFDEFYQILIDTGKRDVFSVHPKYYYQNMFKFLGKKIKFWGAFYKENLVAGLIATYEGKVATYYFGASSNKDRRLMSPYLLQWEAICDAKKNGYSLYDFMGIADPSVKNDSLKGVTQFKTRFGGEEIKYVDSKDFVNRYFVYFFYRIMVFVRKLV